MTAKRMRVFITFLSVILIAGLPGGANAIAPDLDNGPHVKQRRYSKAEARREIWPKPIEEFHA